MDSRIREVRRARRLSLQQVAGRCRPSTTPQTIGRLETGTRTLSVAWLNRIADALGVQASDLVTSPGQSDVPMVAILGAEGARAPQRDAVLVMPQPTSGTIGLTVKVGTGDYRSGDEIWLRRLEPEAYVSALNRDVLVPRPGERFVFGRLIGREDKRLQILALGAGQRQMVVADPPWIAVATTLIRGL